MAFRYDALDIVAAGSVGESMLKLRPMFIFRA
jgi:hypothetical protein